ncbi:cathepsin B-like precursor [Diaphorina citri]|uniref:Cathepsin B-like cysteine peptidase n=1 Tax=Diaphorina citri TaxID=121845 RepID=A0A0U4DX43_DIACI|nr:cathepsin B-like precursor [Diaphorina citri]ALX17533.1 cathepsin B-like cysteine peptidase [Diaphorina citri]KAI5733648.1 hypothetical protein M8J76_014231 [Diaphorina citri]
MWAVGVLVLIATQSLAIYVPQRLDGLSVSLADIVDQVNNNVTSTWQARHNFHPDTPVSYLSSLAGTRPLDESDEDHLEFIEQIKQNRAEYEANSKQDRVEANSSEDDDLETMGCQNAKGLPRNFDAREKWPECPSLRHIADQSNCGSCWAVSVANAISDRLCIASNGYFTGQISAQHIVACTPNCWGCNGGWPQLAWRFWGHNGVVTGGDYNSQEGCQPYTLAPCEHHVQGPLQNCTLLGKLKTPECKQNCYNPSYESTYRFDLKKGKKAHMVPRCNAMRQIYEHGPLVAIFSVYADFLQYKSGVYQHNFGDSIGLHAVRVLGWGVENDIPYWLVANSWNDHWGDHGTFKILRGENEADVEMGFNVGYPQFLQV